MSSERPNAPFAVQTVSHADMVERLAFAACGASRWPNPYAVEYYKAVVRRIIGAMTLRDLDEIAEQKRKPA